MSLWSLPVIVAQRETLSLWKHTCHQWLLLIAHGLLTVLLQLPCAHWAWHDSWEGVLSLIQGGWM